MVRKSFKKRDITIGIAFIALVISVLSFYIWHQTESVRLGYRTGGLEETVNQLRKEVEKLETIKASLLSLDRVERISRKELKLSAPEKKQIVYEDFDSME
jgi:cell division protein FtsL